MKTRKNTNSLCKKVNTIRIYHVVEVTTINYNNNNNDLTKT